MTDYTLKVERPATFYPAVDSGKYHAVDKAGNEARCKPTLACDVTASPIRPSVGLPANKVHKIICKRCLKFATWPATPMTDRVST